MVCGAPGRGFSQLILPGAALADDPGGHWYQLQRDLRARGAPPQHRNSGEWEWRWAWGWRPAFWFAKSMTLEWEGF